MCYKASLVYKDGDCFHPFYDANSLFQESEFEEEEEEEEEESLSCEDLGGSWTSGRVREHLGPALNGAQMGRVVASYLLSLVSLSTGEQENKWVISDTGEILWPLPDRSYPPLEKLLIALLEASIEDSPHIPPSMRNISNSPKREPIFLPCTAPPLQLAEQLSPFTLFDTETSHYGEAFRELLLLERIANEGAMSPSCEKRVARIFSTLRASYYDALVIPDDRFAFHYGSGRREQVCLGWNDATFSLYQIGSLLNTLRGEAALKLLDLFQRAVSGYLSVDERDRTLAAGEPFVLPMPTGSNPLSLVAELKAAGFPDTTLRLLLRLASTPEELYAFALLLTSCSADRFLPFSEQQTEHLEAGMTLFFRTNLYRLCSRQEQKRLLTKGLKCQQRYSYPGEFLKDHASSLYAVGTDFFYDILSMPQWSTRLQPHPLERLPNAVKEAAPFSCGQLIHIAFAEAEKFRNALERGDLQAALAEVRSAPLATGVNVINQCIEHGSERDPLEASLLETVQNGLDAYMGSSRGSGSINVYIEIVQAREEGLAQLMLKISDPVGFSDLRSLMTNLLLPNFSEKSKQLGLVGEMGNGFFQIFKTASSVTIRTRTVAEGRPFLLYIEPVRAGEKMEVIDLKVRAIEESVSRGIGSEITILFLPKERQNTLLDLYYAQNFLDEQIGQTQLQLMGCDKLSLKMMVQTGTIKRLEAYDRASLPLLAEELIDSATPFRLCKLKQQHSPGWVLTGGLPFLPLSQFLIEEGIVPEELIEIFFSAGFSLFLPVGSYTPVQSRSRLHISQEHREELRKFLLSSLLYLPILSSERLPLDRFFLHFGSSCGSFDQLVPRKREFDIQAFFADPSVGTRSSSYFHFYQPPLGGGFDAPSFVDWLHMGLKELVPQLADLKEGAVNELEAALLLPPERWKAEERRIHRLLTARGKEMLTKWSALKIETVRGSAAEGTLSTPRLLCERLLSEVVLPWWDQKIEDFLGLPSRDALVAQRPECERPDERHLIEKGSELIDQALKTESLPAPLRFARLKEFIEKALTFYTEKFSEVIKLEPPPRISLVEAPLEKGVIAEYDIREHAISLRATPRSFSGILQLMASLLNYRLPTSGAERRVLFVSQGDSGDLNHELEHARRGDGCDGGHSHGVDAEGRMVHFEACAASFARAARRRSAIVDLMDYVQELALELGEDAISLLDTAVKLKEGRTVYHDRALNDLFRALEQLGFFASGLGSYSTKGE